MKNNIMLWGVALLFIVGLSVSTQAQPQKKEETEAAKPLELPNFVIERVEEMNINIGKKQKAQQPEPLNANYLDSLNSFEKQTVIPIAPETFPNKVFENAYRHGFLRGDFGRFSTVDIEGGYGLNMSGYELYANAGLDISNGHSDNANYTKSFAKISSDYIAPMKYFLFGGSRTKTSLAFKGQSYNLYGSDDQDFIDNGSYHRNTLDFDLKIHSDGNYNGVQFQTGAGYQTLQILNDNKNASQNSFQGYVRAQKYWHNFFLGGNIDVDAGTVNTDGCSFIQADVSAKYLNETFSFNATAGFQYAATTVENDRGGVLLAADIEYRLNDQWTIFGDFRSGLKQKTYSQYYYENPYLNLNSEIDYTYDIALIHAGVLFHPTVRTGVSAKVGYNATKRFAYFADNTNDWAENEGTFNLLYADATGILLELEGWFYITPNDKLLTNIEGKFYSLDDDEDIPYLPKTQITVEYQHRFIEKLNTGIGIVFASGRYADIENTIELDSYIDININADFAINDKFKLYMKGENLLNQNIYLHNNYKLWGLFIKAGVLWQF